MSYIGGSNEKDFVGEDKARVGVWEMENLSVAIWRGNIPWNTELVNQLQLVRDRIQWCDTLYVKNLKRKYRLEYGISKLASTGSE